MAVVATTAAAAQVNGTVEVAGPEVLGMDQWLPESGAQLGQTRLSEWLSRQ